METAQVGESNPPPPGSPQPPEPGPTPAPELAVEGECSHPFSHFMKSCRGSPFPKGNIPTPPGVVWRDFLPSSCPSATPTAYAHAWPLGEAHKEQRHPRWHLVAWSHQDPLQAVPSPWRDVATRRGCPHSLHARPSSAREVFGCAHSHCELTLGNKHCARARDPPR